MSKNFKLSFSNKSIHYSDEEIDTVIKSMQKDGVLTQGDALEKFEENFSKYLSVEYSFAMNSATSALELAAQLCQFDEGDEFICPTHTYTSSAYPFIKAGGVPIWADINLDTRVVSLEDIERKITQKTKAIIVVHLYGFMIPEIEEIAKLAKEKGILLIEDVAQAIGTEGNLNNKAGTYGDFSVFSFHSHKNITTLGEGGMLVVKSKEIAKLIPMLRHNGHSNWPEPRSEYWKPAMGNVDLPMLNNRFIMPSNFCIGEVECALGSKLLERIDRINDEKRNRALLFIDELAEFDLLKFHRVNSKEHNYHLLVAYVNNNKRDKLINLMSSKKQIQCVVQYYPLHFYDLYRKLGYGNAVCPNSEVFFNNMISFPFHHSLSDTDLGYLLDSTKSILKSL